MNLFVCSTPYQVFNAVNIKKTIFDEEISDLYILNVSKTSVEIYNNIKNEGIFRKVYLINVSPGVSKNRVLYYFNRITKVIFANRMIPNKEELYDRVFIVGTEVFSKLIYSYWYKRNNNILLHYFEDGTASYFKILMEDQNKLKHKILSLFNSFDILDKCTSLYVYRPECVMNRFQHIEIKPIPLIQKTEKYMVKLKEILQGSNQVISNQVVFFDSNFGDQRILKQQIEIVNRLGIILNDTSLCIKLHPSTDGNQYGNQAKLLKTTEGFEMINLGQNMSNKILISIISSACITPKLIYDEEPYVIYLYKLIGGEKIYPFFNSFVESVRGLYKFPERVIVPSTFEELESFLIKIQDTLMIFDSN